MYSLILLTSMMTGPDVSVEGQAAAAPTAVVSSGCQGTAVKASSGCQGASARVSSGCQGASARAGSGCQGASAAMRLRLVPVERVPVTRVRYVRAPVATPPPVVAVPPPKAAVVVTTQVVAAAPCCPTSTALVRGTPARTTAHATAAATARLLTMPFRAVHALLGCGCGG